MSVKEKILDNEEYLPENDEYVTEDDLVTMPDLRGNNIYSAIRHLKATGLVAGLILYEDQKIKNYTVLRQSIKPGEKIPEGQKVNLVVSGKNAIDYLPSIFAKNDKQNNNFLKRYLWIFQTIFNSINLKLDNLADFFNPMEAPDDFLKWIASWFSLNINYEIEEIRLRMLVKEAVNLYQWRGTAVGIKKFLEIISGVTPQIIEQHAPYREYTIEDDKLIERPILDYRNTPYYFTVSFPVPVNHFSTDTIKMINEIINKEKPANTAYYIIFEPDKSDKNIVKNKFNIGFETVT